ncbi:MAG: RnfABCDGE type electron transport complex subunit B [Bacteroidales bacterium]|nr:RnfABCDGE type electron transport complex subunit B [Bacteroidales bacterium]
MNVILIAVVVLALLGLFFGAVIFFVEKKFKVEEDPRIEQVAEILPGANCGGCGFAGCKNFAEAIVKAQSLDGLFCPVGGNELSKNIADTLGLTAQEQVKKVAVIRCQGSYNHSPAKVKYEGITTCAFAHLLYPGEGGCPHGCFGLGDCVRSCKFDAIFIDPQSGLPVVIEDKCTACGACVKACPREIIELRNFGPKGKRIYVACVNKEKGAIARKNCSTACIGCGACVKACPYDAIILAENLAYIDFNKCKLCRKCVEACPTDAIVEINFPPRKVKAETDSSEAIA